MEGNTTSYSVEANTFARINQTLSELNQIAKSSVYSEDEMTGILITRLKLLTTLYNDLFPYLSRFGIEKNNDCIKKCDYMVRKMNQELSSRKSGKKKTEFVKYADSFEREMRTFIHHNINREE